MKLKTKTLVVTLIVSLMVLIIAGTSTFILIWYNRKLDSALKTLEISNSFINSLNSKNNFFITKDEKYLSNLKTNYQIVMSSLAYLISTETNENLKRQYNLLREQFKIGFKISKSRIDYEKQIGLTEDQGIKRELKQVQPILPHE